MITTEIRPAPNAIVILLIAVVVPQCVGCHRDVKAGCSKGYECTPPLTGGGKEKPTLLKRAPEQGIIQLLTGGTVKCIQCHMSY